MTEAMELIDISVVTVVTTLWPFPLVLSVRLLKQTEGGG